MILLLGRHGLFGQHFCRRYPDIIALGRSECDITQQADIIDVMRRYRPDVVINAAGVVPKAKEMSDTMQTLTINALGPRLLADLCELSDCRLIHLSTNDVFSGRVGKYRESDFPSPVSPYGMSKALGEVQAFPHTTIRTSLVGFPDERGRGLLAWAASQKRLIGYNRFLWNGVTAVELAEIIMEKIVPDAAYSGIVHIHGETISKYDLIMQAAEVYGWNIEIVRESDVAPAPHICDRTLHGRVASTKTFRQQLEAMKELWNEC